VRESDGLAMSSRNAYLSPSERQAARVVPRALSAARMLVEEGKTDVAEIIAAVTATVAEQALATLQYAEVLDPETLTPPLHLIQEAQLLVAVYIGKTRLIDNCRLMPRVRALP
jgi:pantoate--beta-alanine ligase